MAKNNSANIGKPPVQDVTEDTSVNAGYLKATGIIPISDTDPGQAFFQPTVTPAAGDLGTLTIAPDGAYTYSVSNGAVQYLGAGDTKVDTFTVTSLDGTKKQVTFTIHGTNDAAVIGTPTQHDVTENAATTTLTARGTLAISDADQGEAGFRAGSAAGNGNLGALTISATGNHTYSVANSSVAYLNAGEIKIETFTVTSKDGTTRDISFTIHGVGAATGHPAVIGDPDHAALTEDSDPTTLSVTGTIPVSDADAGQAGFQTATTPAPGNFGTLILQSSGAYTYSIPDGAVQYLGTGQTRTETFTVKSIDGTTRDISFTITGVNDAPSTPTDGNSAANTVVEGAAVGTTVGITASATDIDGPTPSWSLIGDTSGGGFKIDANTGVVTVADPSKIDFETSGAGHSYSITAQASDGQGGTSSHVFGIAIGNVNEAPAGTDNTVQIAEDTSHTFIAADFGFTDPSDSFAPNALQAVKITTLPGSAGTLTNNGNPVNAGDFVMAADIAAGHLVFAPAPNANGSPEAAFTFQVQDNGGTANGGVDLDQSPNTFFFNVTAVQDAPDLQVADASGAADAAAIPLSISAHPIDDGGSLGPLVITGIPDGYTLSPGTFVLDGEGGGHWEAPSDPATLAALALVPGPDAHAETLVLHVSVASIDGGHVMTTEADLTVTVAAGQLDTSSFAVEGYIAGAFVFADADNNGVFTPGEASAITAADGSFSLHDPHGTLIMTGGTDISTGLAITGTLKAPEGSTVVTPLTTLVTALVAGGATAQDATLQVAAAFGLGTVDLTTFDPVPAATSGNAAATAVLAAGVQVQSTIAQMSALDGVSTTDVVSAIADAITNPGVVLQPGETILTSSASVQAIAASSGVDATALQTVTDVVQAANTSIQSATNVTQIAQAGQVAQGDAAAALAAITDFTDTAQTSAVTTPYVENLSTQVHDAVVASAAPILGTSGNDVRVGTAAIDTIDGLAGNDQISGLDGADVLFGGAGNDRLAGNAGDDRIDGGTGFDRALYDDATGGIVAILSAGTVTGAGVGADTLVNIEAIVGSDSQDTFDARGFAGDTATPGTPIGFSEFEGRGGNDDIFSNVNSQGATLTRVSYVSATSGVTVDLVAGSAIGDASVGQDTFHGALNGAWGSSHDDTLRGSNNGFGTAEVFAGFAGNDTIDGRGGFDRADYNVDPATTALGITVNLASGIVTGDSTIGTDTLRSVEAVRGTFAVDHYDATGFGAASLNAGSLGTFNEFTGNGGDDVITGNGATRLGFNNATAGVNVDFVTGIASGDISVGTDHFTGVNAVQASMFDDVLSGGATNDTFTGLAGNDTIDGRGGFDVSSYNNIFFTTGGVTVNMALGTVDGDASSGHDTLRSIEGVQGTNFVDHYDATGYGVAGAFNIGNNGNFNQFEGLGGDDVITGNGNTRVMYTNAAAAVTVNLSLSTAHGTAANDLAFIGTDVITGANSITGSAFDDLLTGDANSNTIIGGAGNDTIDGGAGGDIAIFTGARNQYTITTVGGVTTVTDNNPTPRDGIDTLTNVEVLQFSNVNVLLASGTALNPVDLSDGRLFFSAAANPLAALTGSADDFVRISGTLSNHQIDLGAGLNDTVVFGVAGFYALNLLGVEKLVGSGGNDNANLTANVSGLVVDLGGGNDNLALAAGVNALSVTNVEGINSSDLQGAGPAVNDVLTLLNNVSGGLSVNLNLGNNTLNLASGANTFVSLFNVQHVNGTAGEDFLTVTGGINEPGGNPVVDLGGGVVNTLNFAQGISLTALNIQHINGSAGDDFLALNNDVSGMFVDLGAGTNDIISLAGGVNALNLAGVESITSSDFQGISNDALTLLNNVSGGLSVGLNNGFNILTIAAGANTFENINNVDVINGSASDDTLTIHNGLFTPNNDLVIDLGAGTNDTLTVGSQFGTFALQNVEHLVATAAGDSYTLTNVQNGLTVDLGTGSTSLQIAAGVNTLALTDVSIVGTSDYSGGPAAPTNDVLNLLTDVTGLSANLQQGDNTLNLAAGTNSLATVFFVQHINGSGSDDVLTMLGNFGGSSSTIDMGGGNDVLNFAGQAGVTVVNAETVNGSSVGDFITIGNTSGATTVTGGLGTDTVVASTAADDFNFRTVADSSVGHGDTVVGFDAAADSFTFTGMAHATPIHFMDTAAFDGSAGSPHSEARLSGTGPDAMLQIDLDGDGLMGANDVEVFLQGHAGTLHDQNFILA